MRVQSGVDTRGKIEVVRDTVWSLRFFLPAYRVLVQSVKAQSEG